MKRQPMKIKMTDETGKTYFWTVYWTRAVQLILGKKPRQVQGWTVADHEGYERFIEGNWINFVPVFHEIARNYNFTSKLS